MVTATGTINITPNNTVTLLSAANTNNQTLCINTALTNIRYTTTGATGATFSGLPTGVTGAWAGNVVTISGTPTVAGAPFNYTVTLTGGCSVVTATGTINVTPNNTVTLLSAANTNNQTLCINTALTNIRYTTTGATGATFSGLPTGVTGAWAGNVVTISGTPTVAGAPFYYTVTLTGGCSVVTTATGTIKVDPIPVGGQLLFQGLNRNTYLVCHNQSGSSRDINLTPASVTGSVLTWQTTTTPSVATSWTDIPNTQGTYTYSGYSIPSVTTLFRAVISSGTCGIAYSNFAVISVIPADIKPSPVQASLSTVCIGTAVQLTSQINYSTNTQIADGGSFNNGNPAGWLVDGCGNCLPANGDATQPGPWALTNGPKSFNGTIYDSPDKKFAIVRGNVNSIMQTPVFSTLGLSTATLRFNQAYVLTAGAQAIIELSLDGGANYSVTLSTITGAALSGNTNGLNPTTIDLQNYVGQTNLKIRFRYIGNTASSWAIDQIAIPDRPLNVASTWSYTNAQGVVITVNNQQNLTVIPDKIGLNTYKITSFLVTDDGNECRSADPNNSETVNVYVFDKYTSTAIAPPAAACGKNNFQLGAQLSALNQGTNITYPTPDGYGAPFWEVLGTAPAGYSFSNPDSNDASDPSKNPNAIFNAPNEGAYTLRWTMTRNVNDGRNASTCPIDFTSITINVQNCIALDFDGLDDFVDLGDYTGNYSIEAWIRPEASTGVIISTKNREISMSDLPGILPNTRWYHVAVDSNGKLYVDGIDTGTTINTVGTERSFIGAKWTPPNASNFFSGWIEELRIWNGNISQDQIRFLMNQRLQSGANIGMEIPMPSPGLPYTSLVGYYKLLSNDILNGGYTPNLIGSINGKLRNMTTLQENTAPLPYTSNILVNGQNWETDNTWTNFDVRDAPNSLGIDNTTRIDWNIVKTNRDIVSNNRDVTLLGLLVDDNELTITGTGADDETNAGTGLWVTHYLKIDGKIDLVGESQLVQKRYTASQISESIFDNTSVGYIERDQQGTSNPFNYNYWGSPVAPGNASLDIDNISKNTYSIGNILFDGTISRTDPINYPIGLTANNTAVSNSSAAQISTRWLYTYYNGVGNTYSEWDRIGATTALDIGLGYTMKGSGNNYNANTFDGSSLQNYVFVGKPNNGTITNSISRETGGLPNDILLGNPYPSSFDAYEFIRDNIPLLNPDGSSSDANSNSSQSIFGTLYFWEHYPGNNTHILRDYQGGYAPLTLIGGQAATTPPATEENIVIVGGAGTIIPKQYVPIGQGFFITGSPGGGDIKFENDQRHFKTERNDPSVFMRAPGVNSTTSYSKEKSDESIKRIRLTFKSPEGAIRPLLLGFVSSNKATDGVDYGYDALNNDNFPSDLSFSIAGKKFVIQGVGAFDITKIYPLDMTLKIAGKVEIALAKLENFDTAPDVFIHDALLDTYTKINGMSFQMQLEAGSYTDRFSIVFRPDSTLSTIDQDFKEINVKYLQKTDEIYVKTPASIEVRQVYLINIAGQTVRSWNMTNMNFSQEFKIPVKDISEGNYILKVETNTNSYSKKVIVKF